MRMVFLGPPGVGKGTQAARLTKHLSIPHLSTGEMLRVARANKTEVGQLADGYMSQGRLVPDSVMLQLVEERLTQPDCRSGYLLDGFPRTQRQAEALDEMLRRAGTPLTLVAELQADSEELVRRMESRGREDDKPEIVRKRLEDYIQLTAPLTEYFTRQGILVSIDGTGTPDEVFDRIVAAVGHSAHK
jgi:adenylate kinase